MQISNAVLTRVETFELKSENIKEIVTFYVLLGCTDVVDDAALTYYHDVYITTDHFIFLYSKTKISNLWIFEHFCHDIRYDLQTKLWKNMPPPFTDKFFESYVF